MNSRTGFVVLIAVGITLWSVLIVVDASNGASPHSTGWTWLEGALSLAIIISGWFLPHGRTPLPWRRRRYPQWRRTLLMAIIMGLLIYFLFRLRDDYWIPLSQAVNAVE